MAPAGDASGSSGRRNNNVLLSQSKMLGFVDIYDH